MKDISEVTDLMAELFENNVDYKTTVFTERGCEIINEISDFAEQTHVFKDNEKKAVKKAVLISIKPEWCELIASGEKTVEVRKTRPKLETPFKCYIYCTKPSKKYQTICGCIVLNSDELYKHPTQGIKHGDSIELMGRYDYTEDNFLNGKVIGEFVCNEINCYTYGVQCPEDATSWQDCYEGYDFDFVCLEEHCLSRDALYDYGNKKTLYAWHISNLVIYDEPRELGEFRSCCSGTGNENDKRCKNCSHLCFDNDPISGYTRWCNVHKQKPFTRPPQSWCYVER